MGFFKSLFRGKNEQAIYQEYEALFDEYLIQYMLISEKIGIPVTKDADIDMAMQKASSQIMQKYKLTSDEMLNIIGKGTTKWSSFRGLNNI